MVMKSLNSQRIVPCTVVGDGMVGKTSIARAFVDKVAPNEDDYVATVFDNYAGKNVSEFAMVY